MTSAGVVMMNEVATKEQYQLAEPVRSESGALMTLIERMAVDKEINPDRVERAYTMYKEVRAAEAEQEFNRAMSEAHAEIQPVVANSKNSHTKSRFADLSAVHATAKEKWTKHGFSVVTKTVRSDIANNIKGICEVRHSGGHKEVHEDDWPLDMAGSQGAVNKTPIQAKGSSITYARRYTELMIFDIAIDDDDDGNGPVELVSEDEASEIKRALQKTESDVKAFCSVLGCENVDSMPREKLNQARDLIKQREKSMEKKSGNI